MNKNDFKLIIIVGLIGLIGILFINFTSKKSSLAEVYYDNQLLLKIDLNIDKQYIVEGENGEVVIEVKDNKIRVTNENSPLHLCSKQGYIDSSYESIICLPNKIVVKIASPDKTLDAIAK